MFYDNQVLGGFILSKLYEGLFIFPESLSDDALEKSIDTVKSEIESLGGSLEKSVKMGKKYFTRELNKEKSGHYVVLVFNIEGSKVDAFKARLKLSTDVFRYQFSVLSEINSLASEV